jgi:hypothetical protein
MQLYSEILDAGGPAFGAILRHVRDSPHNGFLFHCTGALPTQSNQRLLKNASQLEKIALGSQLPCSFS